MVRQTVKQLLIDNEQHRQPDEKLEAMLSEQLPANCLKLSETQTAKSRIRIWRSEYNRGLWGKTPCYSFRYFGGVPVNRNLNPLPEAMIRRLIMAHPLDPRKEKYAGPQSST